MIKTIMKYLGKFIFTLVTYTIGLTILGIALSLDTEGYLKTTLLTVLGQALLIPYYRLIFKFLGWIK